MLRHSLFSIFLVMTALCFLAGGAWLWFGYGFLFVGALTFDVFLPDDLSSHADSKPWLMNFFLFMTLPLLYLNVLLFNWQLSPDDVLGIGGISQDLAGIDILTAKLARSSLQTVGAYFTLSLLIAAAGTVVAHELVHRTWDRRSLITGRWLLALSCDTSFSIEHVYGHHANVATVKDPASARRGEGFWSFFPRSTLGSYRGAWEIEKARMIKRKMGPIWSHRNVFLRGQLMSLAVLGLFLWAQSLEGILSFALVALAAKLYLELINYIEHYGLVRDAGQSVEARHSWNCNARFSLFWLYNLPRHAHHHAKGHFPFWKLEAHEGGPTLPYGYMAMIMMAAVPPLFKKRMESILKDLEKAA